MEPILDDECWLVALPDVFSHGFKSRGSVPEQATSESNNSATEMCLKEHIALKPSTRDRADAIST